MNTEEDIKKLKKLFKKLKKATEKKGCSLEWHDEKGTVFFVPKLPAKD
jgi:hypothetical protein